MRVDAVQTENFRLLQGGRCEFSPGVNVIAGANAQGKTNLLEAIRSLINDKRDWADSHRSAAPLRPAEDAVVVDTTNMDFAQSKDAILQVIRRRTQP